MPREIETYCACAFCANKTPTLKGPDGLCLRAAIEDEALRLGMSVLWEVYDDLRRRGSEWVCRTCAYDISVLSPPAAIRNKGRSRAREKNEPYEVNCLLCGFNANGAARRTVRISEEHARDLGWCLLPEVRADDRTQRFENWVCAECSDDVRLVAEPVRSQDTLVKALELAVKDAAETRHVGIAAWISGGMPQKGALVLNVERSSNVYHQKLKEFYEEAFGLNRLDG